MFTKQQVLNALDGLIEEAERLHLRFLSDFQAWTGEFAAWLKACESTLEAVFGASSEAFESFRRIYFLPPHGETYANDMEAARARLTWFECGLRYAHSSLIGYRYSVERLAANDSPRASPFVFISHGGPSRIHVDAVKELLEALGLAAVVVSDCPNLNFSINEKVYAYMAICSAGIALATAEDETTARERRARPNVENEIGMMSAMPNLASRIVYLKEPEVEFASNYREKVWIPFSKARVQDAFTPIVREIRAFGLIG